MMLGTTAKQNGNIGEKDVNKFDRGWSQGQRQGFYLILHFARLPIKAIIT